MNQDIVSLDIFYFEPDRNLTLIVCWDNNKITKGKLKHLAFIWESLFFHAYILQCPENNI